MGSRRRGRLVRRHWNTGTSESCASLLGSMIANVTDGIWRLAINASAPASPSQRPATLHCRQRCRSKRLRAVVGGSSQPREVHGRDAAATFVISHKYAGELFPSVQIAEHADGGFFGGSASARLVFLLGQDSVHNAARLSPLAPVANEHI